MKYRKRKKNSSHLPCRTGRVEVESPHTLYRFLKWQNMWTPESTGMGNLTTALWNKGRGSIEIVVHVQYVQIGRSANGANAMIKYAPTYNIRYGRDVQKFIHHLRNCNLGKLYCHAPKIRIERNLWWILIFKSRNDPFWPLNFAACKWVGIKDLDNMYY